MNEIARNQVAAVPLPTVINKMTGDMKFVGIMYIIMGAFYCLSIIGAIFGVPLIICGVRLRESADAYLNFMTSEDQAALHYGFERQGRYFFIQKVLFIVGLVLFCLYIFAIFIAILVGALSHM